MSFDKLKATRNAQKYLQQGKTRAAIDEYKKIAANDPSDVNTLNILGDLYIKSSMNADAMKCFKTAGEYYIKNGYSQKAIAIYNKIARFEPDSIEVNERLAALYWDRNCYTEARDYYTKLAKAYETHGRKAEALSAWKQVAQLDPDDTAILLKIGESFFAEGMMAEAASAFSEAGTRFAEKNKHDYALTAFRRALEAKPGDSFVRRGLVTAQSHLGFGDEAVQMLEETLAEDPNDREAMSLLSDCYLQMENPIEAERVITHLVEIEPSSYMRFLTLVEGYIKVNDVNSAVRILSMTIEHLLIGGHADELERWLDEILARDHEQMEAIRLSVRLHGYRRDEVKLKSALDQMMNVARSHNSLDDERFALQELVNLLPHEITYAHRLQQILSIQGASVTEQVPPQVIETPAAEVPTFESFQSLSENADGYFANESPQVERPDTRQDLVERFESSPSSEFSFGEKQNHAESDIDRSRLYGIVGSDNEILGNKSSLDDGEYKPSRAQDDYAETVEATIVEELQPVHAEASAPPIAVNRETSRNIAPTQVPSAKKPAPPKTLSTFQERFLTEELDSVSYFVSQGFQDLAEKTLNSLESQFGARPEILELRRSLSAGPETVASTPETNVKSSKGFSDLGAETENAINDPAEIRRHESSVQGLNEKKLAHKENAKEVEREPEKREVPPAPEEVVVERFSNDVTVPESRIDVSPVETKRSAAPPPVVEKETVPVIERAVPPVLEFTPPAVVEHKSPVEPVYEPEKTREPVRAGELVREAIEKPHATENEIKASTESTRKDVKNTPSGDLLGLEDSSEEDSYREEAIDLPEAEVNSPVMVAPVEPKQNAKAILSDLNEFAKDMPQAIANPQAPLPKPVESSTNEIGIEAGDVDDAFDGIFGGNETKTEAPSTVQQEKSSFDQFYEMRKELGVDEEGNELDSDYETRYEFGIAYKEMGLYIEAISAFQEALHGLDPNDGTRRYFEACHSIGYCFMQQDMPRIALKWYKAAYETADLNEDERNALRYEIGNAYAIEGKNDLAAEQFEEIFSNDVTYRDVQSRLKQLKSLV